MCWPPLVFSHSAISIENQSTLSLLALLSINIDRYIRGGGGSARGGVGVEIRGSKIGTERGGNDSIVHTDQIPRATIETLVDRRSSVIGPPLGGIPPQKDEFNQPK